MRTFFCAILLAAAGTPANRLNAVGSWAIQLQGLESDAAAAALLRRPCDLVVIDDPGTVAGHEGFDAAGLVRRIRDSRGRTLERKLCLAYLDVGQAERFRSYWRSHWKPPEKGRAASPSYLLCKDPNGWDGDFPVAYWDFRWRPVLWGAPDAPLDRILRDGFDGVFLDWVAGYSDSTVAAAAKKDGVDPAKAMVDLIRDLRSYARRRNPRFLILAQNAAPLARAHPEVNDWVDGYTQEDLSFSGAAGAKWGDEKAGDAAAAPSPRLLRDLAALVKRGKPVFTLDYARQKAHVAAAEERSRALGCVPFVSLSPLDRLP